MITRLRSADHHAIIEVMVEARHAANLSQRELALRLQRSNSFVWKFEAGERTLKVCEFLAMCRALEVSAEEQVAKIIRRARLSR